MSFVDVPLIFSCPAQSPVYVQSHFTEDVTKSEGRDGGDKDENGDGNGGRGGNEDEDGDGGGNGDEDGNGDSDADGAEMGAEEEPREQRQDGNRNAGIN